VHQVMEQAIAAGATLVKAREKIFWGGYSGYFKDLDGRLWEVAHNPFFWIGPERSQAAAWTADLSSSNPMFPECSLPPICSVGVWVIPAAIAASCWASTILW